MNVLAPVSDKLDPLIRRLSTDKDGEVVACVRAIERMIHRVHSLGPRPLAELLTEIAVATGDPGLIAGRLQANVGLDSEVVRALGADSFAPMPLGVVR